MRRFVVLGCLATLLAAHAEAAQKPNVVIILADDK